MQIYNSASVLPNVINKSLFLAGPTPRSKDVDSWRPEALKILELLGYDGTVFVPENYHNKYNYDAQIIWECNALNMSDCILFWIPRELEKMPGFTTNDEWGSFKKSGRVVLGAPPNAPKMSYQRYFANKLNVPFSDTLSGTIKNAINMIGVGSFRENGECKVPLMIWKTKSFQSWYNSQKQVGNYLKDAKLLWNFNVGNNNDKVFAYTLLVNLWVDKEQRFKTNEFIFSRTDVCSAVLYCKNKSFKDTEIILVKEFRSTVRNQKGLVFENPGGSSFNENQDPVQIVANEVFEETGIKLSKERFRKISAKQLVATVLTHISNLYSVELTNEEMNLAKESFQKNKTFGNITDSEITSLHITTVDELMQDKISADWSTIGMIMRALYKEF